ncbi:hypothetical protein K469DRAFT_710989 [Zopfia rhizophila CBS 207.26]|uniref:Chalcone isomerase domain-containing protein n=1 Tax=Zopfia rhizophila CBS 207.26 TaxID=1314779 RepID=A0A6A6DTV7_9PEZI|nr:hypothetical protein K469DRAFT_710989 [Zopfia rhizophila CBS 207.26]
MYSLRQTPRHLPSRILHRPIRPFRRLPQLRNASEGLPRSKSEAGALLGRGSNRGPNPLDSVSLHRAEAMRRAYYIRRRNWLALGAALSMIAPIILVRFWELPEKDEGKEGEVKKEEGKSFQVIPETKLDSSKKMTEEFQGKTVVVAAGDKIIATKNPDGKPSVADADAVELVETGTSHVPYFPRTIQLPTLSQTSGSAEYTLLGLGIRTVSFLSIQVYVVGLYVKITDLSTLQNHLINSVNPTASALIPGEKEELKTVLLDAESSTQIWESILSQKGPSGVEMAIRVVPTRGTDFKHLQDGWMRGVASRTDEVRRKQQELIRQQAKEEKKIALPKPVEESEFADESFGLAMKEFKALFQGRGKAPKGSIILLRRNRDGEFGAYYQSVTKTNKGEKLGELTKLGEVKDERVSRLVWLLYLGGKNVSSEPARKSIVDGCIGIVERPIGTVEGMVS